MLTDDQIRSQLSEWIPCDFEIVDKGEMEAVSTPDGRYVEARDDYLRRYRARLAALRALDSVTTKLLREHERVVEILEALPPGEVLTYWEVRTKEHVYAGVSSKLGMVSFYGPHSE
jgi:hypothetical protein